MICLLFLFVLYNYAAMFVYFHHANVFIYNNKLQLFFYKYMYFAVFTCAVGAMKTEWWL